VIEIVILNAIGITLTVMGAVSALVLVLAVVIDWRCRRSLKKDAHSRRTIMAYDVKKEAEARVEYEAQKRPRRPDGPKLR
jgi:hypothetical protein